MSEGSRGGTTSDDTGGDEAANGKVGNHGAGQNRTGVAGLVLRLAEFTRVMYKPHYLLYGILWVLALEATAALVAAPEDAWRPGWATLLRIVIVAFVLLYLRMVDEQKDLEYDRVHNPDRLLVTGAVTANDLRAGMAAIAVGAVVGSLLLSVASAVAIVVVLGYGLGLWGLEQASEKIRTDILANLMVTYPVQLLLTAYVLVSAIGTGEVGSGWGSAPVAVIFAGAFLQFEFARKTAHAVHPGQHYYSNVLGTAGSVAASLLCVAVAVVADVLLVQPWEYDGARAVLAWVPVMLVLIPCVAAVRFLRSRSDDYPLLPPVVFILALYLVLIAQAAVAA